MMLRQDSMRRCISKRDVSLPSCVSSTAMVAYLHLFHFSAHYDDPRHRRRSAKVPTYPCQPHAVCPQHPELTGGGFNWLCGMPRTRPNLLGLVVVRSTGADRRLSLPLESHLTHLPLLRRVYVYRSWLLNQKLVIAIIFTSLSLSLSLLTLCPLV